MNRHNKRYSEEEVALLIRAKTEVDEKMENEVLKEHIGSLGGVWDYISKVYFNSKRKPKALAEQYRKEFAKLEEAETEKVVEEVTSSTVKQLNLPFQDKDLLKAVNTTNRLLQRIIDLLSGDDPNPNKDALILPLLPKKESWPIKT